MEQPQPEVEDYAARIAELVKYFEETNNWEVQEKAFELLECMDRMHRTCIWRLYELTHTLGGKGLIDRLQMDKTIKFLFILYDLLPPEPQSSPEESSTRTAPPD